MGCSCSTTNQVDLKVLQKRRESAKTRARIKRQQQNDQENKISVNASTKRSQIRATQLRKQQPKKYVVRDENGNIKLVYKKKAKKFENSEKSDFQASQKSSKNSRRSGNQSTRSFRIRSGGSQAPSRGGLKQIEKIQNFKIRGKKGEIYLKNSSPSTMASKGLRYNSTCRKNQLKSEKKIQEDQVKSKGFKDFESRSGAAVMASCSIFSPKRKYNPPKLEQEPESGLLARKISKRFQVRPRKRRQNFVRILPEFEPRRQKIEGSLDENDLSSILSLESLGSDQEESMMVPEEQVREILAELEPTRKNQQGQKI